MVDDGNKTKSEFHSLHDYVSLADHASTKTMSTHDQNNLSNCGLSKPFSHSKGNYTERLSYVFFTGSTGAISVEHLWQKNFEEARESTTASAIFVM